VEGVVAGEDGEVAVSADGGGAGAPNVAPPGAPAGPGAGAVVEGAGAGAGAPAGGFTTVVLRSHALSAATAAIRAATGNRFFIFLRSLQ
jgi:hypothetical protein